MRDDPAFVWDATGRRPAPSRERRPPERPEPAAPDEPADRAAIRPEHAETDAVLVPIDEWARILSQLGNLHQAGRELAEARERAAKAETESVFLRERLREMRGRMEDLEAEAARPDPEPEPTPAFGEWFLRRLLDRRERRRGRPDQPNST